MLWSSSRGSSLPAMRRLRWGYTYTYCTLICFEQSVLHNKMYFSIWYIFGLFLLWSIISCHATLLIVYSVLWEKTIVERPNENCSCMLAYERSHCCDWVSEWVMLFNSTLNNAGLCACMLDCKRPMILPFKGVVFLWIKKIFNITSRLVYFLLSWESLSATPYCMSNCVVDVSKKTYFSLPAFNFFICCLQKHHLRLFIPFSWYF